LSTVAPIPLGAIGFSENVAGYLFRNVGHMAALLR